MALLEETYEKGTFEIFKTRLKMRFGEENLPADKVLHEWFREIWIYAQKSIAIDLFDRLNEKVS